jgi:hypothetical protein
MQHSKRYLQVRKVARVTFWLLAAATIYFLATHLTTPPTATVLTQWMSAT